MTQLGEFRIDNQLLAESDALLAAIVRTATDAIIALDAAGHGDQLESRRPAPFRLCRERDDPGSP